MDSAAEKHEDGKQTKEEKKTEFSLSLSLAAGGSAAPFHNDTRTSGALLQRYVVYVQHRSRYTFFFFFSSCVFSKLHIIVCRTASLSYFLSFVCCHFVNVIY